MAGLFVMVGWKVRWVAGLLAQFILVDTFLANAYWAYPATERHGQLLHFLKNLSTLGGLMLLAWFDAAPAPGTSSKPDGTSREGPPRRRAAGPSASGTPLSLVVIAT